MGILNQPESTGRSTPAFETEAATNAKALGPVVSPQHPTQVTTPVCRLVYPNLASPRPDDAEIHAGKYTMMVLIPKEDQATYDALQAAANQAAVDKFKRVLPNLRMPVKDGDEKYDKEGNPVDWYAGHWYLNLSSANQPRIIDPFKNKVDEASFIKGGDWCRVRIAFKGYDSAGNKGVGSYVNVVQFIREGDALGGSDTLDDFAVMEEAI